MDALAETVVMAKPRRSVGLLLAISAGIGIALELVWIGGLGWLCYRGVTYLLG
jgi:hypothetical protein